jgi:hypothetical protein
MAYRSVGYHLGLVTLSDDETLSGDMGRQL